jgi:hypothetical protein
MKSRSEGAEGAITVRQTKLLNEPIPPEPVFELDMETVRQVKALVVKAPPPISLKGPRKMLGVRNLQKRLKRRGGDSFRLSGNEVHKLQIQHCQRSQDCHRCQGALP